MRALNIRWEDYDNEGYAVIDNDYWGYATPEQLKKMQKAPIRVLGPDYKPLTKKESQDYLRLMSHDQERMKHLTKTQPERHTNLPKLQTIHMLDTPYPLHGDPPPSVQMTGKTRWVGDKPYQVEAEKIGRQFQPKSSTEGARYHPYSPLNHADCNTGCECINNICVGKWAGEGSPCKPYVRPQRVHSPSIQPASHPANQSPIDNIIQGIGNIFNPHPMVTSPAPIGEAPVIIGWARRQARKITQDVPYSKWAPQMWGQFNQLAADFVDSNDFAKQVYQLVDQIPCKECKVDAEKYVKTNPPQVADKTQAQNWIKQYHTHVDQVAAKKGWGYYQDDPSESWAFLHDLAEHFDPDTFAPAVHQEISELPPEWQPDCYDWVRINPPEDVESREQARYWMCRFHNRASLEAGNGLVNCGADPRGHGYVSGHEGFSDFYYGRGGGHRGGNRGRRGGQMGGEESGGQMRHGGRRGGRMGGMHGYENN